MADRTILGYVGFVFGGITVAVVVTAATVVMAHVDGRTALDPRPATLTVTDAR